MPTRRSLPQRVSDSFRVIRELDLSHRYERQAGTMALLVLAVVLAGATVASGWLVGSRRPVRVVADFPSANGLSGGDPVLLAGVPVGRVRRVELVRTGRVRVTMSVARRARPRRDAQLEIVPVNLLGDVAVRYRPGADTGVVAEGEILAGRATVDFAARVVEVRQAAEGTAVAARAFLRRDFAADLAAARAATARAREALADVPRATRDALSEALTEGEAALRALDSLAARVPADSIKGGLAALGGNAGELMNGVGEVQARLATIQERIADGQGNVGLATRNGALRRELEATRRSLDDLLFKYLGRPLGGRPGGGAAVRDSVR